MSDGKTYVTLAGCGEATLIEKKSEFIAYAAPVKSEEEALAVIKERKKKYPDATHHVYAYLLNGGVLARYSDDGEPQGSSGVPVLSVLKNSGCDDLCVVVTRYFGGTLLGVGGLVRAYSGAARDALDVAGIAVFENYAEFTLTCGYAEYQKLQSELPKMDVTTDRVSFGAEVELSGAVRETEFPRVSEKITELFAGRIVPTRTGTRLDSAKKSTD